MKFYITFITVVLIVLNSCQSNKTIEDNADVLYFFRKDYVHSLNRNDSTHLENDSTLIYQYELKGDFNTIESIKIPYNGTSKVEYNNNQEHILVMFIDSKVFSIGEDTYEVSLYSYMSSTMHSSFFFYYTKEFGIIRQMFFPSYNFLQLIKENGKNEQILFNLNELIKRHMKPPALNIKN